MRCELGEKFGVVFSFAVVVTATESYRLVEPDRLVVQQVCFDPQEYRPVEPARLVAHQIRFDPLQEYWPLEADRLVAQQRRRYVLTL